jgi:hypothetical protein
MQKWHIDHHIEKESWRFQSQNHHACHTAQLSICHWIQYEAKYSDMKQCPLFRVHVEISSWHNGENYDRWWLGHHRYICICGWSFTEPRKLLVKFFWIFNEIT